MRYFDRGKGSEVRNLDDGRIKGLLLCDMLLCDVLGSEDVFCCDK